MLQAHLMRVYLSAIMTLEEIVDLAFNQLGLDLYRIQKRYNHVGNTNFLGNKVGWDQKAFLI